ncbi:hypothetical protein ACLOJK_032694 [Asimina triloba]
MNVDAAAAGINARKGGVGQQSRQPTSEEYEPSSDWTRDDTAHVLLLDVTGFKKDDLKLQIDNLRKIIVSGDRSVGENRRIWFKQIFQIPEDSDVSKIRGKFDNGLLFVIMPKKEVEKKDEDQKIAEKDGTKEEMPEKEAEKKAAQEDGTKEEMPKKEAEKKVSQKDGTKEQVPTEKREEIERGKSMKEGMPTSKEQEKVQKEKTKEEGKLTTKEQDKTMEEGMRKDQEQQEVQDDATAQEGIPTKEEEQPAEEKEEEIPDETEEEPDETEEEPVPATKQDREPEKDVGSVEGSKDGKKDGSDDKKEDSKIGGGREEVMKKSGEMHKMMDFGEKMYERGREVLGDDFCDRVMEKIKNNRAIIATAVVAFSLGFYLSSKLKRSE